MTASNRPSPLLQSFNELLHEEPFSFLFHGFYWCFILLVASPLAGVTLIVLTLIKLVRYLFELGPGKCDPKKENQELAVLITGCDSGFGRDLTLTLASKGFVVFAGCLFDESMKQYEGESLVKPMKMDVTKDTEVEAAYTKVAEWMQDPDRKSQRHFHALVNNAGIGHGGLVDWLDLSVFQQDLDVNYLGMIRTVKAFFPIFKSQAIEGTYQQARIINIVSMAGLIAGSWAGPYHGSKFAAEAFSTCLRLEMIPFGVKVVTINPSFHETPLTNGMRSVSTKMWNSLSTQVQEEYGEDFFKDFLTKSIDLPESVMWRASVVTKAMVSSVESAKPPPQVIVGSDAKYLYFVMRQCPAWLQGFLQSMTVGSAVKPKILSKVP